MAVEPRKLLQNRLDIHDRKQFELKLEYQPSGRDPKSEYRFEMFMFLPASLNIGSENYPRQSFYSDIHNYVRLKTPVLNLGETPGLGGGHIIPIPPPIPPIPPMPPPMPPMPPIWGNFSGCSPICSLWASTSSLWTPSSELMMSTPSRTQ